ncbi:uncharacterized protein LOC111370091 [Olea europaea var. sylvestris]|uniref:uncharacterized protein LOC111370091 n=1 Tax=Olea europaea var. sylvestris TaxID=158386 RepID=UPI000C1D0B57|nr:uncharacterized protein LOC111370091 [Olea europaea var. sylvestris]
MSKFEDPNIIYRPSNIQNDIRREFGIDINYNKAWMARECAIELLRGSPDLSYDRLAKYCNILKKNNPGTVTFIEIDNENRFKYFVMALGPSIRGFHSSMRHVISVDRIFMKSKFRGTLLVATCQDANLQIYPLAFGIVDSENNASWTWFFDKLFHVMGMLEGLVFISDCKEGIGNAIKIVYPYAHHGCCMWHLQLNIKSNYHKADILPLFMATAKEYSLINFEKSMANLYCKSPAVGQYLEKKVGYEFWSRAHFKGIRYNIMTTNNAESLNSLFKNAREFPVLAMVEQIRKTLQKWFYERHIEAEECATTLTPPIEDKMRKKYNDAKGLIVVPINEYELHVGVENEMYIVNLEARTCSCREFDLKKLPYKHALAVAKFKGISCCSLCSLYYISASWKQAYAECIYPVTNEADWEISNQPKVLPPLSNRRQSGRPKNRRIPSRGEGRKTRKCSRCGQRGHNRLTCKNTLH